MSWDPFLVAVILWHFLQHRAPRRLFGKTSTRPIVLHPSRHECLLAGQDQAAFPGFIGDDALDPLDVVLSDTSNHGRTTRNTHYSLESCPFDADMSHAAVGNARSRVLSLHFLTSSLPPPQSSLAVWPEDAKAALSSYTHQFTIIRPCSTNGNKSLYCSCSMDRNWQWGKEMPEGLFRQPHTHNRVQLAGGSNTSQHYGF